MIFEVWKDGLRKFWTTDKKCIPSKSQQLDMKRNGYKIIFKEKK